MNNPSAETSSETPMRRVNVIVGGTAIVIGIVVVLAFVFTMRFVDGERQRDLQAWQIRMGIVANSRVAAVNDWVDANFDTMGELSENASLQLYMTELTLAAGAVTDPGTNAAEAEYLRNLLTATAERTGFTSPVPRQGVAANVERIGIAGIGLVDATGRPVVSTPGMPPVSPAVRRALVKALGGEPAFIDVYMGASNLPTVGFVLPVFAIQGDSDKNGIGAVIGIRVLDADLFDRLNQPGDITSTSETYLVRETGGTIEYLSPLANGTAALKLTLDLGTPDLAAAAALKKPGGFALKRNYSGEEVLATSRQIARVPWVLLRNISRREALSTTETRTRTFTIVFALIIIGVTTGLIAVWRHGTSLRATEAAEKYRIAAERFEGISEFLNVVTDSQPTAITAVDSDGNYTFANEPAAHQSGISPGDMIGKSMASVIGPVRADILDAINKEVLARTEATSQVLTFADSRGERTVKADHVPIRATIDHPAGVLMVLDDITELTNERQRSEATLKNLINTLVSVVDRRDPYSAHHSSRTAEVACSIAAEMNASELDIRTVEIAGSLMNLGKIFVPPELLTKTTNLTDEERTLLAGSYRVSADLLENVPFEGPVVETIRQMNELWDGSGPLGISGDNILLTGRILSVANTFVGMISPRAYRDAMTFEKVSVILLEESAQKYDRKAVSALINHLENRGGSENWAYFREHPDQK